jgi:hypothetical protein
VKVARQGSVWVEWVLLHVLPAVLRQSNCSADGFGAHAVRAAGLQAS